MSVLQVLLALKIPTYYRQRFSGKSMCVRVCVCMCVCLCVLTAQYIICRFPLRNTGQITLSYKWFMIKSSQPEELDINTLGDDSKSSVTSSGVQSTSNAEYSNKEKKGEDNENRFVFIEPHEGEIPPGSEQIISVKFSPLDLIDFKYNFRCK